VFLDLRRDAYLGVDSRQSEALADLVDGWPAIAPRSSASPTDHRMLAETLRERGLLDAAANDPAANAAAVNDAAANDAAASNASQQSHTERASDERLHLLPSVTDELIHWDRMPRVRIRLHHLFAFLRSLLLALWMLRCRSLFATVRRFERRRRHTHTHTHTHTVSDHALACDLLSIYTLLRMFAFARRGRCLLDSVVLLEFLAGYGIHVRWVIGVHVRPFSAHSWVQHAQWVLNGSPAFVRHYQPILVV
jgi:hypothetical protein